MTPRAPAPVRPVPMPFTATHVLAVVPLRDTRLPFAALAVGSMTPDLPIFVHFLPSYYTTHSAGGLLTACLPLGLALWLGWELVLRDPTLALLPEWVRRRTDRTGRARGPDGRRVLLAAAAVLIGAATHLVWDAFTHGGRWGVRLVPVLDTPLALPAWLPAGLPPVMHGYRVAQYASSAVGLPLLGWLAWRRLAGRPADPAVRPVLGPRTKAAVWAAALGPAVAAGCLRSAGAPTLKVWLLFFVIASARAAALGVAVWVGAYLAVRRARLQPRPHAQRAGGGR